MRMWMVNPAWMCRQHILGEHNELHAFVGTINKGISIQGYLEKGLLEVHNIQERHERLVEELFRRGYYGHKSPLEFTHSALGRVNEEENIVELYRRCDECRGRIWHYVPGTILKLFEERGTKLIVEGERI